MHKIMKKNEAMVCSQINTVAKMDLKKVLNVLRNRSITFTKAKANFNILKPT